MMVPDCPGKSIEYGMRIGIQIEWSGFEPFESWGLFLQGPEKLKQNLRPYD